MSLDSNQKLTDEQQMLSDMVSDMAYCIVIELQRIHHMKYNRLSTCSISDMDYCIDMELRQMQKQVQTRIKSKFILMKL